MPEFATLRFDLPGGARVIELPRGRTLTIGREDNNDIPLEHETLSRRHARLLWQEPDAFQIEDLRSANGTTLNGAPAGQPTALQDGDRLAFGAVAATFLLGETAASALPPPRIATGETFAARYRLENPLGETTEYQSYRASDLLADSRTVSLKIFRPAVIAQAGGSERVLKTCAQIRRAPAHPHLVRLLAAGRWRGVVHAAAEWIDGHALVDVLRRRGALSVPETVRLARQAAAATDLSRARSLPMPDLTPRAALIAFTTPLAGSEWETVRDTPVERWPDFTLKFSPRLTDSAPVDAAAAASSPLLGLVYELLGHPAAALGAARPARVASLGERGNTVLARWLASGGAAFNSDAAFVDILAQAVGVNAPGETSDGNSPVELPAELLAGTEQLSEHIHKLWVANRRRDGWRYAAERDDRAKEHPHMVSYAELSESEKQNDRYHAVNALRALLHLGYRILPPANSEAGRTTPDGDSPGLSAPNSAG